MIGGMVGNNSSGTTSIKYGVTRDKTLEIHGLLSDGSKVSFEEIDTTELYKKSEQSNLEGNIYKHLRSRLSKKEVQQEILDHFPDPKIHRRCTGYAIDELMEFSEFGGDKETINVAKLLSGSEGTLCFSTEIKLQLDSVAPKNKILVAAQFETVQESLEAVVQAMNHDLYTCELMDKVILDCTKNNREQQKNRFFLQKEIQEQF